MAEVIVIGSASGDPSPDRSGPCILVSVGGKYYQFDAGDGCAASLKRKKIDHKKIAAIFITHMHADHFAGLFSELQMMHLARRREPLAVFIPPEGKELMEDFLIASYLFPENLHFVCQIKTVKPDPLFRDSAVTVYARLNTHLRKYETIISDGNYSNRMESYSYVIKTRGRKIIYTGDVSSVDDFADLLPGCDLLVSEGMHINFKDLFKCIVENDVDQLILTHLSEELHRNPLSLRVMAKKFGIEHMHIVNDGYSLKI